MNYWTYENAPKLVLFGSSLNLYLNMENIVTERFINQTHESGLTPPVVVSPRDFP